MKNLGNIDKKARLILILLSIIGLSLGVKGIIDETFYNQDSAEQSYTEQYIIDHSVDMENIGESNFKTTSIDSQIPIQKEGIKKIEIDLEIPNEEILSGAIYYGNYDKWVPVGFRTGMNKVELPIKTDTVRIDLTDQADKTIKVNSIIVNPTSKLDSLNYGNLIISILSLLILIGSLFFYKSLKLWILTHKLQVLITCMVAVIVLYVFNQATKHGVNSLGGSLAIIGILLAVLGVGLVGIKKMQDKNIVIVFIFLATVFGGLFAVFLPPMQGPDEDVHWIRSYYLGVGNIGYNTDLGEIPGSVQNYLSTINAQGMPFNYEEKVDKEIFFNAMDMSLEKDKVQQFSDGGRTKTYLTYAYLPQSIGIAIGNLLGLSPYWILLLGRLTNLMVWILTCSIALYIMPIRKELFLMVLLIPMNIHQAASLSPDVVLNASCYMLLAYIFYLKFVKERILLRDIAVLIACGIGIVGVKFPYIIIMLMLWIIPNEKFRIKQKQRTIGNIVLKLLYFCTCIIIPITFFALNQRFLVKSDTIVSDGQAFGIIQVIIDALINLGTYFKIMSMTLVNNLEFYVQSMIGRFGWLDAPMPNFIILYIVIVILILASVPEKKEYKLSYMDRGIMAIIVVGFIQMLILALIQWNGPAWVEMTQVSGIQGRYFLPFFLLVPLVFSNHFISYNKRIVPALSMRKMLYLSICFIYTIGVGILIFRYWI